MSATRTSALAVIVAGVIALSGCAAPPTRDDIAERFLLELTDSETIRAAMGELALSIADDALAGRCGSIGYEAGLEESGDPNLVYAWRVTCLTYFESALSEDQRTETREMIGQRALEDAG